MTQSTDAITLLVDDHRAVEELFARYEQSDDPEEQTRIVHRVVHDLAVHGEIEELLFYPRIRESLGDDAAEEAIHEHLEIKKTLNELDKMHAGDDGFDARMRELMAEVRHHVEEEESDIFPTYREKVPAEDLEQLGVALARAKKLVPTRPHPAAPTGPLAKAATSPPVALIDRVRDALRAAKDTAKR
jgi:hemerythrin superfamily protein